LIRLFRSNQPYVYVLLLLYTVLLRSGFLFFSVKAAAPVNYSFAGLYFADWLLKQHTTFSLQMLDIGLIYAEALFFNFILSSNQLFDKQTHIPALLFITLSSCFGEWIVFSVESVARLFIILSMYNLFALSRNELSRENIFYTSLYLSLGSLFYFPTIIFLLVVLVGLFIRSYSIRDFVLILIGFLFPFYFIGIGFYYQDKLKDYLLYLAKVFTPQSFVFDLSIAQLFFLLFVLFLAAYGFYKLRTGPQYKSIKQRRMFNLIVMYILLILLSAPFIVGGQLSYLRMLILPASVFAARIFDRDKLKYYHQLLFAVLIVGLIFFQAGYFNLIHIDKIRF
jgi:hypothetical protein